MLWPEKMLKIRIYSLASRSYELVSRLHELGVLHIKQAEVEGMELKGVMSAFDEVSELLNLLLPYREYVEEPSAAEPLPLRETLAKARALADKAKTISSLLDELRSLKEELQEVEDEKRFLKLLVEAGVEYERLPTHVEAYVTSSEEVPKDALHVEAVGSVSLVLLKKGSQKPTGALFSFPENSPKEALKSLEKTALSLEQKIRKLEERMSKKAESLKGLNSILFSLEVHAERAKTYAKFAGSERVVAIEGWVPEKKKADVEALKGEFGDAVLMEWRGEDEKGPTLIENPPVIKPFELAFNFSSLPKAGEMNASFFYALTFPIIYGMIIGDVFYSLIAIVIATLLKNAFPNSKTIQNLAAIWTIAAVGGVLWGIAFDEWLGASHMFYIEKAKAFGFDLGIEGPLYKGIHRLAELPLLLGLSGLVAIVHLTLGNLLGAYTAFKHNHPKHAIARLGWALAFSSFGALLASYLGVVSLMLPSAAILLVAIALIFKGEGAIGLLELPSLASNSASYFRIAAVGVAGVVLAEIINEMIFPNPSAGLVGSVVLFIIFLLLQSINAFIAAFESTIQGGRLEILEFRSKFIEGGGFPYSPFTLKKR